ncbi:hypothetical protein WMY93_003125 [Mugilogobius chulae]|uniref:RRM domain-containing protein n=1 Tax=Mugilogobius chulae TaxID=88201 RepID=A0AAW0PYM0_9GOBI
MLNCPNTLIWNMGYLEWGNVTGCKIKKVSSAENKAMAYVKFASEKEADIADWNGPHFIGGTEVTVKRVVSFKGEEEPRSRWLQWWLNLDQGDPWAWDTSLKMLNDDGQNESRGQDEIEQ